jgi:hypothetical protein
MLSTSVLFEKGWSSTQLARNKKLGARIRGKGLGRIGFVQKRAKADLSQRMSNQSLNNLMNRKSSSPGTFRKSDYALATGARRLGKTNLKAISGKKLIPYVPKTPNVPLTDKEANYALRFMNA